MIFFGNEMARLPFEFGKRKYSTANDSAFEAMM